MPDKFNTVKHGYDKAEVDSHLEALEAVVKSYKEKDSAIKNAFINAQIAADNLLKNAELEIVDVKAKVVNQLDEIAASIMQQKHMVEEFQKEYEALAAKYLKTFQNGDTSPVVAKIAELETYLLKLKTTTKAIQMPKPSPQTKGEEKR